MITWMEQAHLNQVVDVHLHGFEGFFLSFLGPRFLRLFYESIVDYPGCAGYVHLQDGHVTGFVCGATNPSRFYAYMLKTRGWRFALAALGAARRRPSIVPRLFRALLYPRQAARQAETATLMSITVEPSWQGKGVGAQLVAAFLKDMGRRGIRRVSLTTDKDNNERVNAFYHKMGFQCERSYTTPEGRTMNEYVIVLEETA